MGLKTVNGNLLAWNGNLSVCCCCCDAMPGQCSSSYTVTVANFIQSDCESGVSIETLNGEYELNWDEDNGKWQTWEGTTQPTNRNTAYLECMTVTIYDEFFNILCTNGRGWRVTIQGPETFIQYYREECLDTADCCPNGNDYEYSTAYSSCPEDIINGSVVIE